MNEKYDSFNKTANLVALWKPRHVEFNLETLKKQSISTVLASFGKQFQFCMVALFCLTFLQYSTSQNNTKLAKLLLQWSMGWLKVKKLHSDVWNQRISAPSAVSPPSSHFNAQLCRRTKEKPDETAWLFKMLQVIHVCTSISSTYSCPYWWKALQM